MSNLQQTSKIVEKIFSSLLTAKTRENRIKECIKLLHILENNMVLSIKFDYILNNIDDFSTCDSMECKKLWLQVIYFELEIIMPESKIDIFTIIHNINRNFKLLIFD